MRCSVFIGDFFLPFQFWRYIQVVQYAGVNKGPTPWPGVVSASANVALEKDTGTPPFEVLRGHNKPHGCVSARYVHVAGLILEAACPALRDV